MDLPSGRSSRGSGDRSDLLLQRAAGEGDRRVFDQSRTERSIPVGARAAGQFPDGRGKRYGKTAGGSLCLLTLHSISKGTVMWK